MNKIISLGFYVLTALNAFLFLLAAFSDALVLPLLLNPIGRMHPLLLHLPIGTFVTLIILFFFRKEFPENAFSKLMHFLWAVSSFTAVLSAIMGVFLVAEGGYSPDLSALHKWLGVSFSLFCYLIFIYRGHLPAFFSDKISKKTEQILIYSFGLLLIGLTGHMGANLTHGENFLFEAFTKNEAQAITQNSNLYEAAIQPIFQKKCISCHNAEKKKGDLNLANLDALMKGGKNGAVWVKGNAAESHLIKLVNLPLEDKKHMAPKGKPQLSEYELTLISTWINEGADVEKTIAEFPPNSKTKAMALARLNTEKEKIYDFSAVSEATLAELNTPYCSVYPIAHNSPALEAHFFVSQKFSPESLKNLKKAKDQIIALDLAKMPLTDEQLAYIADFSVLERLNLNFTNITEKGLAVLEKLGKLEELSLTSTAINYESLRNLLTKNKSLKQVFIWESKISTDDIEKLRNEFKNVQLDTGYKPAAGEILELNPPTLVNEEFIIQDNNTFIVLKHSLPKVDIRYTLDGSEPDSALSELYTKPISVKSNVNLKAIALKDGWLKSKAISADFYKSAYKVDSVILKTQPNPKYRGQGGNNLINLKTADALTIQDVEWLGYQGEPLKAFFLFDEANEVNELSMSYLQSVGSYIFPPTEIKLYGGNEMDNLKLIGQVKPEMPTKPEPNLKKSVILKTGKTKYKVYYIEMYALKKLPNWHQGKGTPAWIFIDEIFFN